MLAPSLTRRQLDQKIKQLEGSISRIKEISSKFQYKGKQRINRVALFDVEIKHTNEFTIDLGCDYFAEVRGQEAIKILQTKIKHYQQLKKKVEVELKDEENIKNPKEKGEQHHSGTKKQVKGSYVQKIGEENGQAIFNIVEMEEEEDEQDSKTKETHQKKTQVQLQLTSKNKQTIANVDLPQIESLPKDSSKIPLKQEETKIYYEDDEFVEEDEENIDDFDSEQEEEYDDIIMNHRAKYEQNLQKKEIIKTEPSLYLSKNNTVEKNASKSPKQVKLTKKEEEIPQKISRFKLQRMKERFEKEL